MYEKSEKRLQEEALLNQVPKNKNQSNNGRKRITQQLFDDGLDCKAGVSEGSSISRMVFLWTRPRRESEVDAPTHPITHTNDCSIQVRGVFELCRLDDLARNRKPTSRAVREASSDMKTSVIKY